MHAQAAFFTLCAAACSQTVPANQSQEEPSAAAQTPARTGRVPRLDEIFGQWQVADLNGRQPGEIHVLIGHRYVEAVSQCVPFTFRLPGQLAPSQTRAVAEPVCARTLSPGEAAFGRAAAAVKRGGLLGDGDLLLTGPGVKMRLARPAAPILNPFQNRPGPGNLLMWGAWRVAAVNGGRPSPPMQLAVFRHRVELSSGCVFIERAMVQDGATLRLTEDAPDGTTCERMTSKEEEAAERVLTGEVRMVESRPTRRLLRSAGGTISLER